jgi:Polyketide cyclase / dehydrase and lipid transport
MLKKLLLGVAVIVIIFIIIIALQPTDFRIERSQTIPAAVDVVFAQVQDFHRWNAWSPWAKLDPAMKQTYEGAPAGTGAIYSWEGNSAVGAGRMTLTECRTNELVRIKLEFIKPFAQVNETDFAFKPEGQQTTVTWSMTGKNNFLSKAFGLFVDLDKMVGGDFAKGLAQLHTVSTSAEKP